MLYGVRFINECEVGVAVRWILLHVMEIINGAYLDLIKYLMVTRSCRYEIKNQIQFK